MVLLLKNNCLIRNDLDKNGQRSGIGEQGGVVKPSLVGCHHMLRTPYQKKSSKKEKRTNLKQAKKSITTTKGG